MNLNFSETIEKKLSTGLEKNEKILQTANNFLGEEKKYIDEKVFSQIISETEIEKNKIEKEISENKNEKEVSYDKYKKSFRIKDGNEVSMGEIISARRLGFEISLPEELEKFGDGKKIRKIMIEKKVNDFLFSNLNKNLARNLSEKIRQQDLLKAKAYEKIAERSGEKSEQLGVVAEQIIIGALESLAINRPDLGFDVLEANAYQDVNNKIDFIIDTKKKKRGVGVESIEASENNDIFQGKSIGIQFTINSSKAEHKAEQIVKAKERGLNIDDIIYVQIEQKILQEAVSKWQKEGKSISGPWKFLPPEIRIATLDNLFKDILSEEQIKSLIKNIK
ncbi:MAG TPA: hypothetical protein PLO44_01745 [Candidatus Paceibacterota bacterium]|nr:hypothetical protein [Candidatus Paceibacterota bacterium]